MTRPRSRERSRGFAIVLVLWMMVLLAAIGLHLTGVGRSELRIAGNIATAARAEALADGGVAEAVYALGDSDPQRRWHPGGDAHQIARGADRIAVTVTDEGGKVNPKLAPEPLMAALLRQVGSDSDAARTIAAAVTARVRPPSAAVRPAPLESVEDLADVSGMTPALFAALRPHVTIDSAIAVPRPSDDPVIARALAEFRAATPATASAQPAPAPAAAAPTPTIVAIESVARTGVATFVRDAVVRLDPAAPKGYVVLRWARRDSDER